MTLLTPRFRVSYPKVWKPELNDLNGKMEYSVVALFPKDADLSELKDAAVAALEKKYGTDKSKWPPNLRSPFRDQAEKAKNVDGKMVMPAGYEAGATFMTLKSEQKPDVVDENVNYISPVHGNENEFYAGCWAQASVNPYVYDKKGNKGVNFGLRNIQKVGNDDPLGGRTRPEDDFKPVAGASTGTKGPATGIFD